MDRQGRREALGATYLIGRLGRLTSASRRSRPGFNVREQNMQRRLLLIGLTWLAARPAFALYDAKPDGALAAVQGEWRGALTYPDYSEPKRMVPLPPRLLVALSAPNELVLHYAF